MIKAKFYTYLSLYFMLVRNDKLEHLNIEDLKIKMFHYLAFLTVNVIRLGGRRGWGWMGTCSVIPGREEKRLPQKTPAWEAMT